MNKNYVGENIRIYRERKNITQRELGDRIGKTWEMVSRYERGASSPMKQIDSLADALEIDVQDLFKDPTQNREEVADFNRIPFYTSLPKDLDFQNTKSYIYYTAPDWILAIDRECFVVDTNMVEINDERIKDGKLFISPNSESQENDIVMKRKGTEVLIERKGLKSKNVIGKVLAQEISFD